MAEENLRDVLRWEEGKVASRPDELAEEEPLEIRVRGRAISVTMRTPGNDEELAAGFLVTEGVVGGAGDILRIEHCGRNEFGNVLNVVLAPEVVVDLERLTRHVFASSSCGLCGKATIDAIAQRHRPVLSDVRVSAERVLAMPETMRASQATFSRTGGLHAAAIFDSDGKLIVVREDVGRHNAVDKVIGFSLRNGSFPLDRHVMLVSGRLSFEIVQKALAAGIALVAGLSAPSTLAVDFARSCGQTLIGFLREQRMNVYCGSDRIAGV
ncbi:MAG TPA: formate dehydrogenase accessory sulfurtransferase FdhD [Tepidisphaeraceae bacterium]|jgi:FdhD protein